MLKLTRREFAAALPLPAVLPAFSRPTSYGPSDRPPRKVIVGTVIQYYGGGKYPGVEARLAELVKIIDRVAEQSRKQYGRGPDLIVLPDADRDPRVARSFAVRRRRSKDVC